ncbi:hypothetical protein [Deinococcus misasensis]|uniref:hypothetical protein n=1 Tax=Deinococcus misasensis TaxID=392413 RepID=UPI0005560758|nr:hypothetical protein [Deinococcus misasensis]
MKPKRITACLSRPFGDSFVTTVSPERHDCEVSAMRNLLEHLAEQGIRVDCGELSTHAFFTCMAGEEVIGFSVLDTLVAGGVEERNAVTVAEAVLRKVKTLVPDEEWPIAERKDFPLGEVLDIADEMFTEELFNAVFMDYQWMFAPSFVDLPTLGPDPLDHPVIIDPLALTPYELGSVVSVLGNAVANGEITSEAMFKAVGLLR